MKFIDLCRIYFSEFFEKNYTAKCISNTKQAFNSRIIPLLGNYKLYEITPTVINAVVNEYRNAINERTKKPLALSTINKLLSHISSIMSYAVRMELIEYNPCEKVKLNIKRDDRKKLQFYNIEQAHILIKALDKEKIEVQIALKLALYCGMRKSEIYGLQWNDVNFKEHTIHIQRTRVKLKGTDYIGTTKTIDSNRVLTLPDDIYNLLKSNKKNDGYIIQVVDNSLIDKLHRIQKENDLPQIKLHDLRHTCGTLLLANGIDVKTVSEFLGHTNLATTSIYVHAIDKKFVNASKTINNILN